MADNLTPLENLSLNLHAVIEEDPDGRPWVDQSDLLDPIKTIEVEIDGMSDDEMDEVFGSPIANAMRRLIDARRAIVLMETVRSAIEEQSFG